MAKKPSEPKEATKPKTPRTPKAAAAPGGGASGTPADTQALRTAATHMEAAMARFHAEVFGACEPTTAAQRFSDVTSTYNDVKQALAHKTGFAMEGTVTIHPDWLKLLSQPNPPKR